MNSLKTFITWWLANGSTATDDELVWVVTDVTTEPGKRVKELDRFWFREAVKPH
jgi:hypothetical protein